MVFRKNHTPWNKEKTKEDYPQLSNSGVKKNNIPWNKGSDERIVRECIICKEKFNTYDKNAKFCSRSCYYKAPIWNIGLTAKTDERVAKYVKKQTGRKQSIERRMKMRKASSFYKDGRTSLWELIKKLPEWKLWREWIFKRDNWTCQKCFIRGGYLHPYHIKSFAKLLTKFLKKYNQFSPYEDKNTLARLAITYKPFWNTKNGQTLCEDCHRKTENYGCSYTIKKSIANSIFEKGGKRKK